jgi:hypothetical protein
MVTKSKSKRKPAGVARSTASSTAATNRPNLYYEIVMIEDGKVVEEVDSICTISEAVSYMRAFHTPKGKIKAAIVQLGSLADLTGRKKELIKYKPAEEV